MAIRELSDSLRQRILIITEKRRHVLLLQALLQPEIRSPKAESLFHFTWTGGWSGAESSARSRLMDGYFAVALIIGAERDDADEQQQFIESSLAQVRWDTSFSFAQTIVPEIDRLLFDDEQVVEAIIGRRLSDAERLGARDQPHQVLRHILREQAEPVDGIVATLTDYVEEALEAKLPQLDLSKIRESPEIRKLRAFVCDTLAMVPAPALVG